VIVRQRNKNRQTRLANDFQDALKDVWAVVTFNSNAATEAVMYGIPTFTLAPCNAARPVTSQDLSQIETPSLPYVLMASLISNTDFMIADTIVWKKSNSIPHPASYNRLNRIVEFVFVICRKSELKTFNCNKKVVKTSPKGQNYYEIIDNFITAKNNDGSTDLNKATYSTEFCEKLLKIYGKEDYIVYDPFMGTGTTAIACKNLNMNFIGSEISPAQVEYSKNRI
jgi:DNA modification methylase